MKVSELVARQGEAVLAQARFVEVPIRVVSINGDDFGVIRVGWTAQLCREHFALCSSGTDGLSLTARTSLT